MATCPMCILKFYSDLKNASYFSEDFQFSDLATRIQKIKYIFEEHFT